MCEATPLPASIKSQEETMTEQSGAPSGTPHAFQADVSRLLHLMVHSIYSDRDIFIRELVSNAADACEKLRYEALTQPGLISDEGGFAIKITVDDADHRIIIADNGIGMSHDDLVSALGTIASSGTRAFLDKLSQTDGEEKAKGAELIGQFGIGFYSAFMVADKVTVETRKAGSQEAFVWESEGQGTYVTRPIPLEEAPAHGTRVTLHLNDESHDYAKPGRLARIIREHSSAIAIPVDVIEKDGEDAQRVAEGSALWTRAKSDIKPEEYTDFYRSLSGQFDEPALTIHWRAEGRQEYSVLAFIPGSRPLDLFDPARKGRSKLYVRRVLISQDADLLPGWLRFVRLVVDSSDLPLNVSREMIQDSPVFAAIRKGIVNRLLQELTKTAESNPDTFKSIWENFGAVLKEGLYEDPERRDALFKLARFTTSKNIETARTLTDYIGDLRPNQTDIWYITGDDQKRLEKSPQ
jgi:molecular chaperone HtpG